MNAQSAKFTNEIGLNSRFAAYFIQKSNTFQSSISMEYDGRKVNGKSVMRIVSLGVRKGGEVQISAEGADEAEAVETLCEMVRNAEEYAEGPGERKKRSVKKKAGLLSLLPYFCRRQNQEDLSNEDQT